jgi:hypothetical protein
MVPNVDVGEMNGSKFTTDEIYSHFATRSNAVRDMMEEKAKKSGSGGMGTGVSGSGEATRLWRLGDEVSQVILSSNTD